MTLILRIPREILSQIFGQCIDNWTTQIENLPDKKWVHKSHCWNVSPRRIITQVCENWRDTLLFDPELWRDIDVGEYLRPSGHLQLERDLALSNTFLLRIFFSGSKKEHYTEFGRLNFPQIINQLAKTRHRWVSINRGISLENFLQFVEQPGPSPKFPVLRSLSVDDGDTFLGIDGRSVKVVDAPCLVDISLNFRHAEGHCSGPLTLPWSNLRRAQISFTTLRIMKQILTRLTSVTHLELKMDILRHESLLYSPDSIELPLVDTLKIYSMNSSYMFRFSHLIPQPLGIVSQLRLPGLKTLSLSEVWVVGPILDMLLATQLPFSFQNGVQALEIRMVEESDGPIADFHALFPHLPNLKTFLLAYSGPEAGVEAILKSLTPLPDLGKGVPCPALEQLIIPIAHMHAQSLENFVVARLGYNSTARRNCLNSLEIDCFCSVPEPGRREFAEGLVSALQAFVLHPGRTLKANILVPISVNCDDEYIVHRIYCRHGSRLVDFSEKDLGADTAHTRIHFCTMTL